MMLAVRIMAANVFLITLFAYSNRHFYMPEHILHHVESRVTDFIVPIRWIKVRMLTAVGDICGLRT